MNSDVPDYVGFIKKIMKMLQKGYNEIQALEVELRTLGNISAPPSRPRKILLYLNSIYYKFRSTFLKHYHMSRVSQISETNVAYNDSIFYSGDSNQKFEEEVLISREQRTGDAVKQIWLDIYNHSNQDFSKTQHETK